MSSSSGTICLSTTSACAVQITLIDQNEQFVFKPLLYELINGGAKPEEVAPLFSDLLAPMTSTSFVQVEPAQPALPAEPPELYVVLLGCVSVGQSQTFL